MELTMETVLLLSNKEHDLKLVIRKKERDRITDEAEQKGLWIQSYPNK